MFMISKPMLQLLSITHVDPLRLNEVLSWRMDRSMGPMTASDYYPRLIETLTRVEVHQVARRNLAVLFQFSDRSLTYHEVSRLNCEVSFDAELPETVVSACPGRALGDLIELGRVSSVLKDCRIIEVLPSSPGAIAFTVNPGWIRFD